MRYVVALDTALRLAEHRTAIPSSHKLLSPTLLRSQVLAHLYGQVRRGRIEGGEADAQLDYLRGLRIRLLGDRVLQRTAWRIAARLDWPDTYVAEYVALTRLQADALVILDETTAKAVAGVVAVAPFDVLAPPDA